MHSAMLPRRAAWLLAVRLAFDLRGRPNPGTLGSGLTCGVAWGKAVLLRRGEAWATDEFDK